ncbi:MAG: multidrug effflux MFS transporter [Gemmatimonadetes bacterium]|nr:multidrug effflux MFS transporter [Gemmatimonadota bacterium]
MLSALTALAALAIDMSLPAMPQLQRAFEADVSRVQLTLSLFLLGYGGGQFVCGSLSDHFGRRSVMLIGLGVFTISSFACAFAPSLPVLVLLRLVQGAGASAGPILARAIVRDLFDQHEGASILSHITQMMVLAPILAPVIGGYLLLYFAWNSIFLVLAVCGTVLSVLTWRRLPETLSDQREVTPVMAGIIRGYGRLLSHRPSMRYVLATSFSFAGLFGYISGSPFVFMQVYGVREEHFGYYFALPALALMAGAGANRSLLRRYSSMVLLRVGAWLLLTAGTMSVTLAWLDFGGLPGLVVPLMLYLFGMGILGPNATSAALAHHGRSAGAASSLMGALQTLSGAAGGFLVAALYDHTSRSLATVLGVCALLAFIACRWEGRGGEKQF